MAVEILLILAADQIPAWLQPSTVGLLFGFSYALSVGMQARSIGGGLYFLLSVASVCLSTFALQVLTSLNWPECLLAMTGLSFAGWATGVWERREQYSTSANDVYQWTIWDIGLLTLWVACLASGIQRIAWDSPLIREVVCVMAAAGMVGWIAYRWVWDDHWTIGKVLMLVLGMSIAIGILYCGIPNGRSIAIVGHWMLTGPFSVLAAQAIAVMSIFGAARLGSLPVNRFKLQYFDLEPEYSGNGTRQ